MFLENPERFETTRVILLVVSFDAYSLVALLVILENLITLSWWFFACTFQNLPGLPYIRPSSALTKELFCTQGRDFLCDR